MAKVPDLASVGTVLNGVIFGHDDYLFLGEGGHRVLDFLSGRVEVTDDSIRNFQGNILSRWEAAKRLNAGYIHLISPDKQSVLADKFPIDGAIRLGERYLGRTELAEAVLYPREQLSAAGSQVFLKTDTHMSDLGNLLVAQIVSERLTGEAHDDWVQGLLLGKREERTWVGDLGARFAPPISEIREIMPRRFGLKWYNNSLVGGNNGIVDIIFRKNPVYNKRLLLFGDSFGRNLASFLSNVFAETIFLRTPFFHADIAEQIHPDFIVTQNVERYLSFCHSDNSRPSFFMYPYLGQGQYDPGKEFCEAFSAVLSYPRKPYLEFMEKVRRMLAEESLTDGSR
jgi:hypothetical protein